MALGIERSSLYAIQKGSVSRALNVQYPTLSERRGQTGYVDSLRLLTVLDPQNYEKDVDHRDSKLSNALLDFPLLVEVAEEMMLPRYHLTSGNDAFSGEALDFLSSSLSDSVEALMKVSIGCGYTRSTNGD
jgi:hypothetical protein